MPLFMDIHRNMKGVSAKDLAEAHKKDLEVQGKHNVKFLDYWYNDKEGVAFCLCDAPNKESASKVHAEAHGKTADEVIEVHKGT